MRAALPRPNLHRHTYQRGMSLIFALVALVVLMLGALALVRNVDTATQLLGNLGFKQETTASSEQASRQALAWLNTNALALNIDVNAEGYYASNQEYQADGTTARDPIDITGNQLAGNANRQLIDWDSNNCASAAAGSYSACTIRPKTASSVNGNSASYVILRLCNKSGDRGASGVNCSVPMDTSSTTSNDRGEINYAQQTVGSTTAKTYFRVLVRIKGARNNTFSFTETIVYL